MPNAAPPSGPRVSSGLSNMRRGGPSRGGITKRTGPRGVRVDKDGDLDMDAPTRITRQSARGGGPSGTSGAGSIRGGKISTRGASGSGAMRGGPTRLHTKGQGLVEITVLGWQESRGNRDSLVDFLERKSGTKIKKSRVSGDALIISVPFLQVGEVTKWDGCHYAGSKLSIIASNAPKIASKRDDEVLAGALNKKTETSDTIKILEQVLQNRYNPATKLLDLSRLGEDPILRSTGFFDLASTTSKMFPALMLVADKKFESSADKREAVASISLAYNNLRDIKVVSSLAPTFPDLKNLSLEGNQIPTWKELENWRLKFRKLEQLVLAGNPIVATEGYKEEAMRRYPALTMLDGVILDRPAIKIGAPEQASTRGGANVVITGGSEFKGTQKVQLPLAVKSGCVMDDSGVGMRFLASFFGLYDSDQNKLLQEFYDDQSKFSVSANTLAPRLHQAGITVPAKPWEPYYPASRNLTRVYGAQLFNKLYIGRQRIGEAWGSLPKTKHDINNPSLWSYDVWPIQGLPDINNPLNYDGVSGLIAMVHGEFEEVPEGGGTPFKRSFDRTFTLAPGRGVNGIRIVNDMLVVRAWGGSHSWQPEPVPTVAPGGGYTGSTEEAIKEQKLAELSRRTGLNLAYANLCLSENNWDFDRAFTAFENAKASNLLPPNAFV